jgi:lipopolysaccharide/colanic/teichoic acid biosynthesis glycosyltransferase
LALLAVVALPAAALGAGCALAVRLTSRGPVLFRQRRVGIGGHEFEVLKFRTMVAGDNPVFPDATRITSAGRWLRRLSLDELPQLVNVARGEMSVVGPRPTLPYQAERYDDRQWRRLDVRPGLTGLAQIRGRNSLSWADRIEYDLEYVQRQSVWLDLSILAGTLRVVLTGEGAEGHPTDDPLAVSAPGATPAADVADGDEKSGHDVSHVVSHVSHVAGDDAGLVVGHDTGGVGHDTDGVCLDTDGDTTVEPAGPESDRRASA